MSKEADVIKGIVARDTLILQFFYTHKDLVYSMNDIREEVSIARTTLYYQLGNLRRQGLLDRIKTKRRVDGDFYGLTKNVKKMREKLRGKGIFIKEE